MRCFKIEVWGLEVEVEVGGGGRGSGGVVTPAQVLTGVAFISRGVVRGAG